MQEHIQKTSNNYGLLTIVVLVVIITVGGGVFLFFRNPETPLPEDGNKNDIGALPSESQSSYPSPNGNGDATPPPTNKASSPPTSATFSIKTKDGKMLEVRNFYIDAAEIMPGYVVIKEPSYYRLIFYEADNSFLINIINSNVPTARGVAELELPDILGIQQQQICQLNVSIGVSTQVSEMYGGKNYNLSFCPDGESF